jgi:hypothetical protein
MSRRSPLFLLLLFLLRPPAVAGAPVPYAALATPAYDASARFRAVHVDTLDPKLQKVFEDARLEWLKVLAIHHTTDGRGFFLQRGRSTFITLRSFNSFSEYDALRALRAGVAERIGPEGEKEGQRYDRGDVALLAPHNSEVWTRLESFDYRGAGPQLSEYTAGYMQMVVEQVASDAYEEAWKEVLAALRAAKYPLGRTTFFSSLGSGKHITFWLAASREAFRTAGSPEQAAAKTLGAVKAAALFGRLKSACSETSTEEVVPRPDLVSPE